MDFLGIGPLELAFIFLIVLIVLGPQDMIKTGRVIGRYLRRLMTSSTWRMVQDTSREIRNLPNRLAREAGLEEIEQGVRDTADMPELDEFKNKIGGEISFDAWTRPPTEEQRDGEAESEGLDLPDSSKAQDAGEEDPPPPPVDVQEPERPPADSDEGKNR